jgi:hypothetical protein
MNTDPAQKMPEQELTAAGRVVDTHGAKNKRFRGVRC